MKLDLRSREIKLPNGIVLRVRPLKIGEYQSLLRHVARIGNESEMMKLAVDTDALANVLAVTETVVVSFTPFRVEDDTGERDGVLADLWLGQPGMLSLVTVLGQLLTGGQLPETEAKN